MGDHTAARSSDTGHAGEVNATGGYSTSIPLHLPPTRTGLNIPLSVVSGGNRVGAAGVGWDIPLSYVRIDTSIAKRKPNFKTNDYATGPMRVVLSLGGDTMELVHQNIGMTPNTYVARHDGALFTAVREASDWVVYDGHGRTYSFVDAPGVDSIGLSLLQAVSGPTGLEMSLTYDVHSTDVSPGSPATVVDLTSISYNYAQAMGCAKDEIDLSYSTGSSPPLSVSILSGHMFAIDRVVDTITVQSRTSCVAATTLSTYKFEYYPPPAFTSQIQLQDVKMYGRTDTADTDTSPMVLGTYHYNQATDAGGISYAGLTSISAIPSGADPTRISGEVKLSTSTDDTTRYNTPQNLLDVTGDGIPDFVFVKQSVLWSAKGIATANGVTFGTPNPLGDNGGLIVDSLEDRSVEHLEQGDDPYDLEQIWKEAVDVNGDGRIDIVDAWSVPRQWIVSLNMPSDGPSGVAWKTVAIDTQPILDRVGSYHDVSDGRISLSRRFSGVSFTTDYNGNPIDDGMGPTGTRSFTEWELKDLNGDGFPDFVLNSTAASYVDDSSGGGYSGDVHHYVNLGDNNDIEVMFNVGGIAMAGDLPTFAKSMAIVKNNTCGVEEWSAYDAGTRVSCTFADLTGDGIPERIDGRVATIGLGNGFGGAGFPTPASTIQLPVDVEDFNTPYWNQCAGDPNATFQTSSIQSIRDVTGDGIPDLVGKNGIYMGTGIGFSALVPVQAMSLSEEIEECAGGSYTYAGLYDVDGDGRPELVAIDGAGDLDVAEPTVGGAQLPLGTGRLASIDNGYGATEFISYRSAKIDTLTPHQVPFPEVVVSAVYTGLPEMRDAILRTDYAYGNATMIYDDDSGMFTFPGYARTVSLQLSTGARGESPGQATITDKYGLSPFVQGSNNSDRFARRMLVGRTSAVTKLAGSLATDPNALLGTDVLNDYRVIASTTYDYASRLFEEDAAPGEIAADCVEHVYPYDYQASLAVPASYDTCSAHGFTYASTTRSLRGSPTSNANVTTATEIMAIDDYARPTSVQYFNDVMRGDDDLCVDTTFATPTGSGSPVRDAIATQRTSGCAKAPATWGYDTFQYDGYPTGSVTAGLVTSKTSERHAGDDGTLIGPTIRVFDATYDAQGNVSTIFSVRNTDGAVRETTFTYDPFGMVQTSATTNASNLPPLMSKTSYDLASLAPTAIFDPTGTSRGYTYDRFDRPLTTTVTPPGGSTGVLASFAYLGFTDGTGRRITKTTFDDPVDPGSLGSATGHTSTTYFDELGRPSRTEVVLGASYPGQIMVTGYRTYDLLGRVSFAASPFLSTDDARNAYGVSTYYNADGTVSCAVGATGPHAYTAVTDPTNDVYPTCYYHGYANNLETFGTSAPDANQPGSSQSGVLKLTTVTAIGRRVSESTSRSGATLDYTAFTQDRLGNLTSQTRYKIPQTMNSPVTTSWHYDSFGMMLSTQEPEGVLESSTYDSFDERTLTSWTDAGTTHSIASTYDALGRISHREEQNGGVTDSETVNDYVYDNPIEVGPEVTPTYVLGRLSRATAPSGSVTYSYDAFGSINGETHVDEGGTRYVKTTTSRANGMTTGIDFYLPDTGYEQEHAAYTYDSANRVQAVSYEGAAGTVGLYKATNVDALGHVLGAEYGDANYQSIYDTTGRRLLREASISSASGIRDYKFPTYDAVGRELQRAEVGVGTSDISIAEFYDALGRLTKYSAKQGATTTASWGYVYDPLGNLTTSKDVVGTTGSQISLRGVDEDEACRVEYPTLTGSACNVSHDVMGNIARMPERGGATRTLKYFNGGQVRSISDTTRIAAGFRYDAFGALQEVNVKGPLRSTRDDRNYGANIEVHQDVSASFIMRKIPGPGGMMASLRGPSSNWVLSFGEGKGLRVTTDLKGKFLQDLSYQPFGETKSTGVTLGSQLYSNDQWNGGDALADFNLVHVGARVYDPIIGRFLSRDPIRLTHSANAANPYSFAQNDPINGSDPSGMCDAEDFACWMGTESGAGTPAGGRDVQPQGRPVSTTPARMPSTPSTVSSYADDDGLWYDKDHPYPPVIGFNHFILGAVGLSSRLVLKEADDFGHTPAGAYVMGGGTFLAVMFAPVDIPFLGITAAGAWAIGSDPDVAEDLSALGEEVTGASEAVATTTEEGAAASEADALFEDCVGGPGPCVPNTINNIRTRLGLAPRVIRQGAWTTGGSANAATTAARTDALAVARGEGGLELASGITRVARDDDGLLENANYFVVTSVQGGSHAVQLIVEDGAGTIVDDAIESPMVFGSFPLGTMFYRVLGAEP